MKEADFLKSEELGEITQDLMMSVSCPQLTLLVTSKNNTETACIRLLDDLAREVNAVNNIGLRYFFVLKLPEIRLRLPSRQDARASIAQLDDWREAATRRGVLAYSQWRHHQPELFQFGGPTAYPIAEEHFSFESNLFLKHRSIFYLTNSLNETENLRLHLLAIIIADLLARLTDDSWEAWDCIARMAYSRGILSDIEQATHLAPRERSTILLEWTQTPQNAFAEIYPDYNECYIDFASINAGTAERILQIHDSISFGIRNMAASLALFTLNRGLTTMSDQKTILVLLSQLFNPTKHIPFHRLKMEAK
jgi:thiopeptide-type bacteriocin biosynthesis protein